MINRLKEALQQAEAWPDEDQAELAGYAREIQAERDGIYVMTDDERAAVEEGLAQARRGEFVPDAGMRAFWKRHGIA